METIMETMDGQECWTNAFGDRFGERVCVGIEGSMCWNEGKKFKPTDNEVEALWEDFCTQELGSKGQREKDLEDEFGWTKTASAEKLISELGFTRKEADKIVAGRSK